MRRKYPKIVKDLNHRHEKYNAQMDMVESLQAKGQVYCFNPRADIEIGTYTTEPAVMMKLYDNGVEDATQNINRLKDFLNGK